MNVLLGTSVVLAGVAALDAVRGGHWDQFAMLVTLAALLLVALLRNRAIGETVQPRSDLLAWVQQHAALTDDRPAAIVDRALAAYREELLPTSESTRADS